MEARCSVVLSFCDSYSKCVKNDCIESKIAKRTWICSEPAYVNKTTKVETVSREGRITQTSNADDMRATVGEIVCDSEVRS